MSNTDLPGLQTPVSKLDADNYAAEDLDGVTESLFGSGNLNYLTLQSQQNDLMAQTAAAGESIGSDIHVTNLASGISSGHGAAAVASQGAEMVSGSLSEDGAQGLGDYSSFGQGIASLVPTLSKGGSGSDGADGGQGRDSSVFSSSNSSFSDKSSVQSAVNGTDGESGLNGNNGSNGNNGNNGNNGQDGDDGSNGGGGNPVGDIDIHIDTDITGPININPIVDVILDPIEAIVGDIDLIVDTDLDLDELTDTVGDILSNPVGTIDTVLNGVEGIVNSLLLSPTDGDTDLHVDLGVIGPINLNPVVDVILDPVEQLTGDIDINILPDIDLDAGAVDLNIDTIVAGLPLADASLHLAPPVLEAVGGTLENLPGLDDILQNPQGAVENLLGDAHNIVGSLLGGGNGEGANDTDLHADLGIIPPVEINLDPVEAIVGDIDLDLTNQLDLQDLPCTVSDIVANVATLDVPQSLHGTLDNLVHAGPVAEVLPAVESVVGEFVADILDENPVETVETILSGDGLTGLLGGGPDNDDTANDTDLTLDPQIDILGIGTPDIEVAAVLDPVESVIGDIDINIDLAIDALNGGGVGELVTLSGESTGTGEGGIWPENPVNGLVDNVFDTMLGGGDAATGLPDPAGTVAEGLGILNLVDNGGHHGGGHHGLLGGLFG